MSEQSETSLTFKEKLDYGDLVRDAILTCNRAVLNTDFSERENVEATKNLRSLIAATFEDKQFLKELEDSKIVKKVDMRPEFCGVKPSEEYCEENGITAFVETTFYDYEKLKRACINFFARSGLLTSINLVEEIEEIDFANFKEDETEQNNLQSE